MTIDLNKDKPSLKIIKSMLDSRKYKDPDELIGEMANATQSHIIVCVYYTMHYKGRLPSLEKHLASLIKFYRYPTIIGWPLEIT